MNEIIAQVEVQNEVQVKTDEFALLAEFQLALVGGGCGVASLD